MFQADIKTVFLRAANNSNNDEDGKIENSAPPPSEYGTEDSDGTEREEDDGEDYSDNDDDDEDGADGCIRRIGYQDSDERDVNSPSYMTYVTFNTQNDDRPIDGAIIDSGVCSSVVGRKTLDSARWRNYRSTS